MRLYCRAQPGQVGGSYDISLQGVKVLEVAHPAGETGSSAGVIHELEGVRIESVLDLKLEPSGGRDSELPMVCGIELIEEGQPWLTATRLILDRELTRIEERSGPGLSSNFEVDVTQDTQCHTATKT